MGKEIIVTRELVQKTRKKILSRPRYDWVVDETRLAILTTLAIKFGLPIRRIDEVAGPVWPDFDNPQVKVLVNKVDQYPELLKQ